MAFAGPMEDRLAIRELYDTYAHGANRQDRAVWLSCYCDDARWTTHYFDLHGIEEIAQQYDRIGETVVDTFLTSQVTAIDVRGDTAHCEALQSESLLYEGGATYDLVGRYEDELVRRDGRWRFKVRNYLVKREAAPER